MSCTVVIFFNDTATTEIYTLSLHDALPILASWALASEPPEAPASEPILSRVAQVSTPEPAETVPVPEAVPRSEEHTSELQSRQYLVCRLLLEKTNKITSTLIS